MYVSFLVFFFLETFSWILLCLLTSRRPTKKLLLQQSHCKWKRNVFIWNNRLTSMKFFGKSWADIYRNMVLSISFIMSFLCANNVKNVLQIGILYFFYSFYSVDSTIKLQQPQISSIIFHNHSCQPLFSLYENKLFVCGGKERQCVICYSQSSLMSCKKCADP